MKFHCFERQYGLYDVMRKCSVSPSKGTTGKRGHIVADTLLPTQMFPCLPARATFVADTNFVSGDTKMFLILFRNILCPQQMFPSLRSPRNIMSNNVSSFASTFISRFESSNSFAGFAANWLASHQMGLQIRCVPFAVFDRYLKCPQ